MAQDRSRWDQLLIGRGLAALARAEALAASLGPYQLQAAIAACHARARTPEATDWARIVALYGDLMTCTPSPVVELNRAVAVSMASGRPRRCCWSTASSPTATWRATTCCTPRAATCWPGSTATTRRAPSSSAPPR